MALTDLETIPETGAVFTIGRSRFADNIASHFFIRKDPVISITCGDEHSAVICQSGRLFVFGSNDWGQLGLGHKNHISKPSCVKALKPEKVTHVACGRAHTLICTDSQKIFACGSDQEGQLGRGAAAIGDSVTLPALVHDSGLTGAKIIEIAAGSHHSLALTSDGGVFAWGSNLEGQLGLPDVSGLVNKPTKVHIPEPVKQITAGYYHSTFLTESGLVYVCGETEGGKLGIDVNFTTQISPKQMELPVRALRVACGGHHTLVLAENGNLYCTGSNSSGQLGLGRNVTELPVPKLLPRGELQNEKISRISCGESHTAIVTESGKLFTCGDGRHAKLGLEENENNVHELTFVSRYKALFVSNVACGGCHTILVGHRRETGNRSANETENTHTQHVQKRNSLPPLKIPLSRRQSETRDDRMNETIKDNFNRDKNTATKPITPPIETLMEATPENIEKRVNDNEGNVANNITDSMERIKETRVDMDRVTENSSDQVSSDLTGKNAAANKAETEMSWNETRKSAEEESAARETQNLNSNSSEEKAEIRVAAEGDVREENKTDIEAMADERNNNVQNSDNETGTAAASNTEEKEEMNRDGNRRENTNGNTEQDDEIKITNDQAEEENSIDKIKETANMERQTSATSCTPPPKPPRLKPGSGDSRGEKTSSSSMGQSVEENILAENKAGNEEEKSETIRENDSAKADETDSIKFGAKSERSKSGKSRIGMEETIETERVDAKGNDNEKMDNGNNTQDDADVVESPPPRTGKMSKIFKGRKSQAVENGTKSSGAVSNKPKSKTCSIL